MRNFYVDFWGNGFWCGDQTCGGKLWVACMNMFCSFKDMRGFLKSFFLGITVRILEKGDIRISRINGTRMRGAFGYVVLIPLGKKMFLSVDDEFYGALQNDPYLSSMGVFWQIHILFEMHKDDLMCLRLG